MRPATTEHRPPRTGRRPAWSLLAVAVAAAVVAPVGVVVAGGLTPSVAVWRQLWEGRLPEMLVTTVGLLLVVGAGTLLLGAGLAWLVTVHRFPGSGWFRWLLVLPLAMPAYVLGFVFLALFDYPGPVQTVLRSLFGAAAWFPEVRSVGGAGLVLSLTLYPYVYLMARAALREHAPSTFEVARVLGDSRWRAARRVVLPLARPSLAAGVVVVMMETLTDFASVQYFNVQTVSVGVYQVWRGMFDREAAVELAALVLLFALAVVAAERLLRGGMRFHQKGGGRDFEQVTLVRWRAAAATTLCLGVLTLAFLLPVAMLVTWAVGSPAAGVRVEQALEYGSNSLGLALVAATLCVGLAVLAAGGARLGGSGLARAAARLATVGYAVPGPVVAVGVLTLVLWVADPLGLPGPTGVVVASLLALVYAYVVRFLALAFGAVDASLEKITPTLVDAAHTLGAGPGRVLTQVHLPLVRSGAAAGAVLVAIDALKELPIVLFIRPFGFTTLSVWVWQLASESRWASAAVPALLIVVAALVPVAIFGRAAVERRTPPEVVPPIPLRVEGG